MLAPRPGVLAKGAVSTYTSSALRAYSRLLVLRFLCLLALGTSVALLLDYATPEPQFCSGASGCAAIRESGIGYVQVGELTIPWLPLLGVLNFALLYVLSVWGLVGRLQRVFAPLVYLSAAGAAALIGWQAWLGSFCYLCMMVDISALVIAGLALSIGKRGWDQAVTDEKNDSSIVELTQLLSEGQRVQGVWRDDSQIYQAPNPPVQRPPKDLFRLLPSAWAALMGIAVAAPPLYPLAVKTADVPSVIRELYNKDEITVVEFFDFQCPHCRNLSPRLSAIVERFPEAHLRYAYVPLPGHPLARDPARISICAAEQGKEKEVAAAFFSAPSLEPELLAGLASQLVPSVEKLRACLSSKRPDERIEADTNRIREAGFLGLPTTYVGGLRVLGAENDLAYVDAIEKVRDGRDRRGVDPWAFWLATLALVMIVLLTGRVQLDSELPSKN